HGGCSSAGKLRARAASDAALAGERTTRAQTTLRGTQGPRPCALLLVPVAERDPSEKEVSRSNGPDDTPAPDELQQHAAHSTDCSIHEGAATSPCCSSRREAVRASGAEPLALVARGIQGAAVCVSPTARDRFYDSGRPRRTLACNGSRSSGTRALLERRRLRLGRSLLAQLGIHLAPPIPDRAWLCGESVDEDLVRAWVGRYRALE